MQNFYFYTFYFLGWAQLSPCGLGWTQPARPRHWPGLGKATRVLIHACFCTVQVNFNSLAQCKCKLNKILQEEQIAYLVYCTFFSFFLLFSCDSANGWFPCFWYLIDLLCSLRFSFVVCGCRSCEGILPSLSSASTCPCLPLSFSSGFLLCFSLFSACFPLSFLFLFFYLFGSCSAFLFFFFSLVLLPFPLYSLLPLSLALFFSCFPPCSFSASPFFFFCSPSSPVQLSFL